MTHSNSGTPRHGRLAGTLLLTSALVFVGAGALAVADPGVSYDWWSPSLVSDLGAQACHGRDDRWVCSPSSSLFNAGVLLTGLGLLIASWLLRSDHGAAPGTAFAVLGSGLVVLGAFPSDVAPRLHLMGAILALPGTGSALLLSARPPRRPDHPFHRFLRAIGATTLLISGGFLFPSAVFPKGGSEICAAGLLLFVVLWAATRLLRAPGESPPDP